MSKAGKFEKELILDHRHKESLPYRHPQPVDPEYASTIIEHITRTIAKPDTSLYGIVFPYAHVDILLVPAGFHRPWITLVTCGMGLKEMHTPVAAREFSRMELALCLPQDWPSFTAEGSDTKPGPGTWILPLVHYIARLTDEYDTWLGDGHTIPNGDPPETLADDSLLCCAMLAKPRRIRKPEFHRMPWRDESAVFFWSLVFLIAEEMALKEKKGEKALWDKFRPAKVDELLHLERPNTCKKGLFGVS